MFHNDKLVNRTSSAINVKVKKKAFVLEAAFSLFKGWVSHEKGGRAVRPLISGLSRNGITVLPAFALLDVVSQKYADYVHTETYMLIL